LASLFLKGVEMASFANGVCGEPMKAYNLIVSNYFDGTVFQKVYNTLHHSNNGNLSENQFVIIKKNYVKLVFYLK
jgi:hypothetical protein